MYSNTTAGQGDAPGMGQKPQCGSGKQTGEYDVGLHVLGLFLVLSFSIFGAGFPVVVKKVRWIKVPAKVFFTCKHFGTGVLIATTFVHLLPTAFSNLLDPCLPDLFTLKYRSMPGVIMMASLFTLFVIEMWLNSKLGGHSHGGPIPNKLIMTSRGSTHSAASSSSSSSSPTAAEAAAAAKAPHVDPETGQPVDGLVYRKLSLHILLLEFGILFHSVFVGMTVSLTVDGFVVLLVAILFHQVFEGLGLGSRIAAVPYRRGSPRPWALVVAFSTTAPVGQAIGLVARHSYDPDSALGLVIVGVFNAISAGLLVYASLVNLLADDFLSEEANRVMTKTDKTLAFMLVLAGAAGMSIVGAFA